MDKEIEQLLKDCLHHFELEYGDNWKNYSNDSGLKKTILKLKEVLEVE